MHVAAILPGADEHDTDAGAGADRPRGDGRDLARGLYGRLGVPFGGAGSVEVPAGDYTLDIGGDTESNDGDAVASDDLSLSGGAVYTAVAVGNLTPDDEPADTAFDLVVAQDA